MAKTELPPGKTHSPVATTEPAHFTFKVKIIIKEFKLLSFCSSASAHSYYPSTPVSMFLPSTRPVPSALISLLPSALPPPSVMTHHPSSAPVSSQVTSITAHMGQSPSQVTGSCVWSNMCGWPSWFLLRPGLRASMCACFFF